MKDRLTWNMVEKITKNIIPMKWEVIWHPHASIQPITKPLTVDIHQNVVGDYVEITDENTHMMFTPIAEPSTRGSHVQLLQLHNLRDNLTNVLIDNGFVVEPE